jgi:hypothetical protein
MRNIKDRSPYPKGNVILLQFLHHFKAHKLHFSATWQTKRQTLSLKSQEEQQQIISNLRSSSSSLFVLGR